MMKIINKIKNIFKKEKPYVPTEAKIKRSEILSEIWAIEEATDKMYGNKKVEEIYSHHGDFSSIEYGLRNDLYDKVYDLDTIKRDIKYLEGFGDRNPLASNYRWRLEWILHEKEQKHTLKYLQNKLKELRKELKKLEKGNNEK